MLHCMQIMDALVADSRTGGKLSAPSVSYGAENLFMHGPLEDLTRPNLSKVRPVPQLCSKGR